VQVLFTLATDLAYLACRLAGAAHDQWSEVERQCHCVLLENTLLPIPKFEGFLMNIRYPHLVHKKEVCVMLPRVFMTQLE
jgi:hypothetical protein